MRQLVRGWWRLGGLCKHIGFPILAQATMPGVGFRQFEQQHKWGVLAQVCLVDSGNKAQRITHKYCKSLYREDQRIEAILNQVVLIEAFRAFPWLAGWMEWIGTESAAVRRVWGALGGFIYSM